MKEENLQVPVVKGSPFAAIVFGVVIGVVIFLLLPLSQLIEAKTNESSTMLASVEIPPPPPPPPMEEIKEEKVEEEKIEELENPPPPPSLAQLELSLNADFSDFAGPADFSMNFDVSGDLKDMIFDLSDVDQKPEVRTSQQPRYPPDLQRAGINGQVVIEFVCDENGNVRNPFVYSTTNPGFNDSALKAIRNWKFSPAVKDGQKVKSRVRLPLNFTIKN